MSVVRAGDRVFAGMSRTAGIIILLILAGVAIFLTYEAIPGLTASPGEAGRPAGDGEAIILNHSSSFFDYVWPLVFGTLWAAAIALIIATPLAIALALFISIYAPKRLGTPIGYLVDLLAAVPSVVYGLWGLLFLGPNLQPFYEWLANNLGFIPFFNINGDFLLSGTGRTILTAGIVLAIMILPIITAICREIFAQTPRLHIEAALALGATRWEMIRMAVFPYGRSGIVGATMLGLGRALGETMAVAMVLSGSAAAVSVRLLSSTNPNTIPANIAQNYPEASGLSINVLIATGLILFIITFIVNFAARWIVNRRAEFSGAN